MFVRRYGIVALLLAGLTVTACQTNNAEQSLTIDGAWIREAPPSAPALAGYMVIHNAGGQSRRLLAVESPAFGKVELHRSVIKNGVANMTHQDSITIPAHGSVALEPGSYHMMMMQPSARYRQGTRLTATLTFDSGDTRTLQMPVKKTAP